MDKKRPKIFAHIILFPNHFDSGLISWRCFYPRPNDKDGISVFDCSEINIDQLLELGEKIANTERQKFQEANFYGIIFFLDESMLQNFDLEKTGKHNYHFVFKHKRVDYRQKPVQITPEIKLEHGDLLNESLLKTKQEIEKYRESADGWDIIFSELIDLINEE